MKNKSKNVLDVLDKISDIKFQKDVWLEGKYWDKISDFEEAVNTLEDYDFFIDIDENKIGLSKEEKDITKLFIDKLIKYESRNVEFMLKDNNWISITESAKKVNKILNKYSW